MASRASLAEIMRQIESRDPEIWIAAVVKTNHGRRIVCINALQLNPKQCEGPWILDFVKGDINAGLGCAVKAAEELGIAPFHANEGDEMRGLDGAYKGEST